MKTDAKNATLQPTEAWAAVDKNGIIKRQRDGWNLMAVYTDKCNSTDIIPVVIVSREQWDKRRAGLI